MTTRELLDLIANRATGVIRDWQRRLNHLGYSLTVACLFPVWMSFGQIALARPSGPQARLGCDRLNFWNAGFDALVDSRDFRAVSSTCSRPAGVVNAVNRDCSTVAFVDGRIFADSRPAAIGRAIAARRVDPINRVIGRWALSHVFEERVKRAAPSLADGDPRRSIPREVLALGVATSPLHSEPNPICRADVATALMAVSGTGSARHVSCIAESTK